MWAPLEVADFDAAVRFYGELLGLPRIEEWAREGERGAIFGVGDGRVEIVATDTPTQPPKVAIELSKWSDVDSIAARIGATPNVFPRGHYGFVAVDPEGNPLLVWSEA
ncbi:MAG: VOC family protein [Dehalococcoidia bacterium]